jgi:1-acyl-sn-glycerol-3-phosphate acyltransferase
VYSSIVIIIGYFSYGAAYSVMKHWCKMLVFFSGIKLEVEGLDKIDKKSQYMFIINHTSAFDIPVLVVGIPIFTNFITKKELFYIPIFGQGLRTIGHISIDRSSARDALKSMKKAIDQMRKKGRSLILFPEGTRSSTGRVGDFKRASFALVKDAGIKMVPVLIHGADTVAKKNSWFLTPGLVKIIIADPIHEEIVVQSSKEELKELAYNTVLAMQNNQYELSDKKCNTQ